MRKTKNKEFNKRLLSLVLPIAFQQFMPNLVSAFGALMLGVIGQSELSAVYPLYSIVSNPDYAIIHNRCGFDLRRSEVFKACKPLLSVLRSFVSF